MKKILLFAALLAVLVVAVFATSTTTTTYEIANIKVDPKVVEGNLADIQDHPMVLGASASIAEGIRVDTVKVSITTYWWYQYDL